jgi:hypothetical protein
LSYLLDKGSNFWVQTRCVDRQSYGVNLEHHLGRTGPFVPWAPNPLFHARRLRLWSTGSRVLSKLLSWGAQGCFEYQGDLVHFDAGPHPKLSANGGSMRGLSSPYIKGIAEDLLTDTSRGPGLTSTWNSEIPRKKCGHLFSRYRHNGDDELVWQDELVGLPSEHGRSNIGIVWQAMVQE